MSTEPETPVQSSIAGPAPFAEVAVGAAEVRGARTFHYAVPTALDARLVPGQLVLVEFGKRHLHGVVMTRSDQCPVADPKPILDIIWDTPFLDHRRLEFARWLAGRFGASMAEAVENLLPANIARYITLYYVPRDGTPADAAAALTAAERRALDRLRADGPMSTAEIAAAIGKTVAAKGLPRMVNEGWLRRWTELELPAGGTVCASLLLSTREVDRVIVELARAPKQRALLRALANIVGPVPVKELLALAGAGHSSLKALQRAGHVRIENIYRIPEPPPATPATAGLREAGSADWRSLETFLDRDGHGVCVLLGDPARRIPSYVQAIEKTLAARRQALVLAPTEREARALYEQIAATLSGQVAFSGDARTPGSRVGLWRAVRAGEIDVYVGPRSAVYAPLTRLGLIIVDREEDRSYKEAAGGRVQARDATIELGRAHLCPVVLGTATPAVETFYNVESERYRFILMQSDDLLRQTRLKVGRGWGALGPAGTVGTVDMRTAPVMGHGGMLSEEFFTGLKEALAQGGKAVLLVNRRGSASMTICRECGYVFTCPDCDNRLVQHRSIESLVCHSCNHRQPAPRQCPECGAGRLRLWGHGTESVLGALRALLPLERVDRIDSNLPLEQVRAVAEGFRRGAIRVLVGTSLLFSVEPALKADFLGIVQADIGLTFPDFTAPERVFQQLMRLRQAVLGGDLEGRMVVQSLMPDHHAIEATRIGSYLKFYRSEIAVRQEHDFPPFTRLARFIYTHREATNARTEALRLAELLNGVLAENPDGSVQLMGPAPCFRARERGAYRWHILAYGPDEQVTPLLAVPHRGWTVDVDPIDLV
jgi:primosomal protein N' (replication factor Y)